MTLKEIYLYNFEKELLKKANNEKEIIKNIACFIQVLRGLNYEKNNKRNNKK